MTPSPSMNPERSEAILAMLSATVSDDADARVAASRRRRTRGIVIASMAAAVVVVAAGVGYGVTAGSRSTAPGGGGGLAVPTSEPESPSPSSTPTSSLPPGVDPAGTATPLPTPTPTPTPTNDPADASTWVITTDGVGPIRPGLAISDVEKIAATAALPVTRCGTPVETRFFQLPDGGPQIAVGVGAQNQATFIALLEGKSSTAPGDGGPLTPHGIGPGTTEAELKAAYPGLVAATLGVYPTDTGYGLSDGAGHWIDFLVSNDTHRIREIVVSDVNAVPTEFCG